MAAQSRENLVDKKINEERHMEEGQPQISSTTVSHSTAKAKLNRSMAIIAMGCLFAASASIIVMKNQQYNSLKTNAPRRRLTMLYSDPKSVMLKTPEGAIAVTDEFPTSTSTPPANLEVQNQPPAGESGMIAPQENSALNGYKDVWILREEGNKDTAVFWHIPRTAGSTIKEILGMCHGLTMATEAGVADGHDQDTALTVVQIGNDSKKFVNVNTNNREGLQRAKAMGLSQSGLADVMAVHSIYDAEDIFDESHKGRLFAMVRDPIERAASMFVNLKSNPALNPEVAAITIEEYAQSSFVENNWMTRFLSNQLEGELTETNLEVAKDVARRKVLVGTLDEKEASMERFEKYFGWKYTIEPTQQEGCRASLLGEFGPPPQKVEPGSVAYELLRWQNKFDIELYEYMKILFVEQEALVTGIPDGFRLAPGQESLTKSNPMTTSETEGQTTLSEQQPSAEQQDPPEQSQTYEGDSPVAQAQTSEGSNSPVLGRTYTVPPGSIPAYECPDRFPDGFTDEPLPNPFQLLSGATRPCYDNFADFPSEPNPNDSIAFWHIPKAGGSTIKDIAGACMGLVQADEVGVRNGHDADTTLEVVEEDGSFFVNVDTTNIDGIKRAREMGLAHSGLVDLVTLINIQDADYLFDPEHKGRFFTVFRDPVERAISMYFYLSKAYWEPTYNPALQNMTLLEYTSRGGPVENNFMVRFLVNQRRGPVGEEQLEFAKEVVRKKFLVGLLHKTEESFDRFQKYFGLKVPEGRDEAYAKECTGGLLHGGSNKNTMVKKPKVAKDSLEYKRLASQNNMDIKLYEYALELWEEQGKYFESS